MQQLRFVYGQNKGKNYTEEEDRFLVRVIFKCEARLLCFSLSNLSTMDQHGLQLRLT